MVNYACQHCRDEMSFIDYKRSHYCFKPACQRALGQAVAERKKATKQAHQDHLTALHLAHQQDPSSLEAKQTIPVKLLDSIQQNQITTALVPDNNNQVTELCEARKQAFLNHLKALFNAIQVGEQKRHKVYAEEIEPPLSPDESNLLGKACATCKGYCCTWGGTHHAFQDYPSLQHFLSIQTTALTEDKLIAAYQKYIPSYSYQNACVFQGELGCTLPSPMRSFTCHNYRCSSLISYQHDIAKSETKLTYAAAVDRDSISRVTIFDIEDFIP